MDLPDRYIGIDRTEAKIEYGRYRWQNLPALPDYGSGRIDRVAWAAWLLAPAINLFRRKGLY